MTQYVGTVVVALLAVWGIYAAYIAVKVGMHWNDNPGIRALFMRVPQGEMVGRIVAPSPDEMRKFRDVRTRELRLHLAEHFMASLIGSPLKIIDQDSSISEACARTALSMADELLRQNSVRAVPDIEAEDA